MKLNVKNTPKFTEIKLELGVKQYLVLLHSELTHSLCRRHFEDIR